MTSGIVVVKGIIHGKTIELERETGLPEGQSVSVIIRRPLTPGEGPLAGFGSWAEDSEGLDPFIAEIYRAREDDRPDPSSDDGEGQTP